MILKWHATDRHVLCFWLLLGEDPEDKVSLLLGLKGGGDDEVLSGGKTNPRAHLSQVNESLRASAGWMGQKEIFLQMDILTASVLRVGEKNTPVNIYLHSLTAASLNKPNYDQLWWIKYLSKSMWWTQHMKTSGYNERRPFKTNIKGSSVKHASHMFSMCSVVKWCSAYLFWNLNKKKIR